MVYWTTVHLDICPFEASRGHFLPIRRGLCVRNLTFDVKERWSQHRTNRMMLSSFTGFENHTGPPPPISFSQIYSSVHSSNVPAFPEPISFLFIVFVTRCHIFLGCSWCPVDVYVYKCMGRQEFIAFDWNTAEIQNNLSQHALPTCIVIFIHFRWFEHVRSEVIHKAE